MTTTNPNYISEEQAALNCAAGRHEWSLFGEGPAAYCLHCAATRRNVNAPVIPAPKDAPDAGGPSTQPSEAALEKKFVTPEEYGQYVPDVEAGHYKAYYSKTWDRVHSVHLEGIQPNISVNSSGGLEFHPVDKTLPIILLVPEGEGIYPLPNKFPQDPTNPIPHEAKALSLDDCFELGKEHAGYPRPEGAYEQWVHFWLSVTRQTKDSLPETSARQFFLSGWFSHFHAGEIDALRAELASVKAERDGLSASLELHDYAKRFAKQRDAVGFDDNAELRNTVLAAVVGTPPIEQPSASPSTVPASNGTTAGEMPRIDIPWVSKTELLAYDSSEIELIRQKPDGTTIVHWYEMGRFAASKNISIAGTVHYFEQKGIVPTPEQLKELEAGWKEATREKFIVQPLPAGFDDNKDLRNAVLAAVAGTPPIEQPAPRPPSKAVKLSPRQRNVLSFLATSEHNYINSIGQAWHFETQVGVEVHGNTYHSLKDKGYIEPVHPNGDGSVGMFQRFRISAAGLAALRNADEEARK